MVSQQWLPNRKILRRQSAPWQLAGNSSASVQSANSRAQPHSATLPQRFFRPSAYALHKYPAFTVGALFVLMLSGPPRLRFRDLEASLRGDTDWVVASHVVIWGLAGLWVMLQIAKRFQAKRPLVRLHLPQILGLCVVLGLAVSISTSAAPALTAFKVYQILVSLLSCVSSSRFAHF